MHTEDVERNPLVAIWIGLLPDVPTRENPNRMYRATSLEQHAKIILEAVRDGYKWVSLGMDLENTPHIPREDVYEMAGKILALAATAGLKLVGQREQYARTC